MADDDTPRTPAGWYPDIQAPEMERWWDGSGWTPAVRARGATVPGTAPAPQRVTAHVVASDRPRNTTAIVGFCLAVVGLVQASEQLAVLRAFFLVPALVLGIIAATKQGQPHTLAIWAICLACVGFLSIYTIFALNR